MPCGPERLRSLLLDLAAEWTPAAVVRRRKKPEHPFRHFRRTRRVRDLGRGKVASASGIASARYCTHPVARDALSRSLQPISCHEHPPVSRFSGEALTRISNRRFTACPMTRTLARAGTGQFPGGAAEPLLAAATPGGAAFGRRGHQLRRQESSLGKRSAFALAHVRPACSAEPYVGLIRR